MIQVLECKYNDAAKVFLGFRKGSVRDDHLARSGPQRPGGSRALQRDAVQPLPALDSCLIEGDALLHHRVEVTLGLRSPVVVIDETHAGEFLRLGICARRAPGIAASDAALRLS